MWKSVDGSFLACPRNGILQCVSCIWLFRSALLVKFIHSAHVAADHKFSLLHYVPLYEYTMIYLPILLSVGENVLFWAASRGLSDGLELLNHS